MDRADGARSEFRTRRSRRGGLVYVAMAARDEVLRELEATLSREEPITVLSALIDATIGPPQDLPHDKVLAIGLDANAVLRLANKSRTEVVDYLGSRHTGP